jgi:excisionase family DNA binding protein
MLRALSVREFCDEYGIGLTKFYDEVKKGRLCIRKIGRKTIIPRDEAERWLKHLPLAGSNSDNHSANVEADHRSSEI